MVEFSKILNEMIKKKKIAIVTTFVRKLLFKKQLVRKQNGVQLK